MEEKEGNHERLEEENLILKRQINELNKIMVEKDKKLEKLQEGNSVLERTIDELNISLKQKDKIMTVLANELEVKSMNLKEVEFKYKETNLSLKNLMDQNDKHQQTYNEELRKLQQNAKDHFQSICNEHEKLKSEYESQRKELELLREEKRKIAIKFSSSSQTATFSTTYHQNMDYQLVSEEQKVEIEQLKRELEMQLLFKKAMEREMEQLTVSILSSRNSNMGSGGDENNSELMIDELKKKLEEKEEVVKQLEALNQTLIIKECSVNDELKESQKELGVGEDCNRSILIGMKRLEDRDAKPFEDAIEKKTEAENLKSRVIELEKQLQDDKKSTELEIEQLREALDVSKRLSCDESLQQKKEVDELKSKLKENEFVIERQEAIKEASIVKETGNLQSTVNQVDEKQIEDKKALELENEPLKEALWGLIPSSSVGYDPIIKPARMFLRRGRGWGRKFAR